MHVHLVLYWVLYLICISTYPVIYYGLNIHLQYVFSLLIHELFQSMLFNLSVHIISQILNWIFIFKSFSPKYP